MWLIQSSNSCKIATFWAIFEFLIRDKYEHTTHTYMHFKQKDSNNRGTHDGRNGENERVKTATRREVFTFTFRDVRENTIARKSSGLSEEKGKKIEWGNRNSEKKWLKSIVRFFYYIYIILKIYYIYLKGKSKKRNKRNRYLAKKFNIY